MGDFIIFSVILQALVGIVRERYPALDGLLVNGAAIVLGCLLAYVVPEARVAEALTGLSMHLITDVVASGCLMALGAKFLSDIQKAMATSKPAT